MDILLLTAIAFGFFITYFSLPYWIRMAKKNGFFGKDVHKIDKKPVAEGGGIPVVMGACAGIFLYIGIKTFLFNNSENTIYIFAVLSVLLTGTIIGVMDDMLGWKKGLSKKIRILIVLVSAVPLMVINAGESMVNIPILGAVNFGIFYPLIIIPLGVLGATTTFNFLGGLNGLESSQGIIILSSLAIATYITGNPWLSVIALCMVASLAAFYIFNKYPAEVFPGDVLTYPVGAMIASIAIFGNIEKIAVFFFIPYIMETALKLRGGLKKESFVKLNPDESLEMPYGRIYSLTHLSLFILKKIKKSGKVYEREVVHLINGFQILIILTGFWLFV